MFIADVPSAIVCLLGAMGRRVSALLLIFGLFAALAVAQGQETLADRVLVVYSGHESRQVAENYAKARGIPAHNFCRISPWSDESIDDDEFAHRVEAPVRKCLDAVGKDKILYIVLSYGTPYVLESGGHNYALDAFLEDVWDEFIPHRVAEQSEVQPYFGRAQSEGNLYEPYASLLSYREKPGAKHIYSVWRLDAATPALAKGLVDKAIYAEQHGLTGQGCFDRRYENISAVADSGYGAGDWDIYQAARFAAKAGFPVLEDTHEQEFGTAPAPLRCDGAALYAGWYSLNHYNDAFSWKPGAIGLHLDSASAANPRGGPNWVANAVQHGITITSGAVGEPYLDNLPHPDQALLYLFQGANAGDAMLRSTRLIKWMILNVGDPLYRPFPKGVSSLMNGQPELVLALLPQLTIGGGTYAGVVAIENGNSAQERVVALSSDHPDLLQLPGSVTIARGASYVRFPIVVKPVEQDGTTVRVYAKSGELSRSNTAVIYKKLSRTATATFIP